MKEIPDGQRGNLVVIVVSDVTVQKEIEAVLRTGCFTNILKLGFQEMLGLIAYGVEAGAEAAG